MPAVYHIHILILFKLAHVALLNLLIYDYLSLRISYVLEPLEQDLLSPGFLLFTYMSLTTVQYRFNSTQLTWYLCLDMADLTRDPIPSKYSCPECLLVVAHSESLEYQILSFWITKWKSLKKDPNTFSDIRGFLFIAVENPLPNCC